MSSRPLKVVAFNGSSHKDGNTSKLINIVFDELKKEGIECEMIMLGDAPCVHGCTYCLSCKHTGKCAHATGGDPLNMWWEKTKEADGLILGSPTHFGNVSVEMKSYIDRIGVMASYSGIFRHKVAASVVSHRRGGGAAVYDAINRFISYLDMHIVSSFYWNEAIGKNPEEIMEDEVGVQTMKTLGQNMAFVLKKLHAGEGK